MEKDWFKKSTKGMDYETITEEQLIKVLNYEKVETRKRDDIDFEFRF